ncbi:MAG: hypothetical protein BWY98_01149 [Tenericutes bacterium ADurb.BinA155]|nr:MAG: hypothetical protein BWY98_01149 [Tenericutes bacterium ADurb.BinA155]
MKKSILVCLGAALLLSGCGSTSSSAPLSTSNSVFTLALTRIFTADQYSPYLNWYSSYAAPTGPSDSNAMYCLEFFTLTNISSKTVALSSPYCDTVFDDNTANGSQTSLYQDVISLTFPSSLAAGVSFSFRRVYQCFKDFSALKITFRDNIYSWSNNSLTLSLSAQAIPHQPVYYYPEPATSSAASSK